MIQEPIFGQFINFALAALVGFALGLERDMAGSKILMPAQVISS